MAIGGDGTKALLAIGAALVITGCGGQEIDRGKAEAFVRQSFGPPAPRSVKCPSGVKADAGKTFDCSVTASDGRRYTVTLHIRSGAKVAVSATDVRPAR